MNYSSSIEEVSSTRRKFKISVPQSDVTEAFKNAIQEIQATAEVKGFRKGKVPTTIVRKFFEHDVRKRAIERIIDQSYSLAVREANLQIVSQPHIEPVGELHENQEFKYDAVVDVNPPVEIQGYKELTLKGSKKAISESDVDATLKNLGRALGTFTPAAEGTASKDDDFVVMNLSVKVDNEVHKELSKKNIRVDLGSEQTLPEFRTNLMGVKKGETKTFTITYPADYPEARLAGKTAELNAEVTSVESMTPPTFDNAFAKRFGSDSIENLRRSLLESLTRTEETRKLEAFGEQIVDQLLTKNPFEVPESLVESTVDRQIAEANMRLEKKNHMDPKSAEVRNQFRETAVQNVKAILALGNVARIEKIEVKEDEIGPELFALAQSMGTGVKELVQQGGRMVIDEARGRVLINKTIKHLVGLNKIELE
jgi:trigger factor